MMTTGRGKDNGLDDGEDRSDDEGRDEDNGVDEGEGLDELINRRISEWQERLLQLNRRNSLLYFSPGRSAVEITGVAPDALDERLRLSPRGLRFASSVVRPTRPQGRFSVAPDVEALEPDVVAGDIETNHEVDDLQRRLRNLRRKDREWEEEQGLNVLFLALGFLNWVDADGEQAQSPLVLIPCDLERATPGVPFRLRREDDDPVVNPTLRHRLSGEGIDLPELGEDSSEDTSIELYLAAVDELVEGRPGWYVDSKIVLGTFSYSKLAMYEDLERMKNAGRAAIQSDLVRLLASDGRIPLAVGGAGLAMPPDEELAGGGLDDLLELRDQFAVLPADFSQLLAIEVARSGENLVIHGPPGTGKSQTIANLIATMIADGKRVLFVSEKTAALDVVKRRLEECDLGVFCLDLHSDRGRKAEVYQQLQRSLDDDREVTAGDDLSDQLVAMRKRLNRLTRLLHERRGPLGLSIFEVQGYFERRRHHLRFEALALPPFEQLTREWLHRAVDAAQGIARRPREFTEHHTSRWQALRTPQAALALADLIRQDMQAALDAIRDLRSATAPFTEWLERPQVRSTADLRNVVALLRLLAEAPGVPGTWLQDGAPPRLRQLARRQAERQGERDRLKATLSQSFRGQPLAIDYRAVQDAISLAPSERDAIAGTAGPDWNIAIGRDPAGLSERVNGLSTALDRLIDCAAALSEALGEPPVPTLARIETAAVQGARVLALDPIPEHWLELRRLNEVESRCADWRSLADGLSRDEARLGEDFSDDLTSLVDEQMLIRYRTDHQSTGRRALGMRYRRDRRILHGQLREPRQLSLDEQRQAVELALEVKRGRDRWEAIEPDLRESLGERSGGRETDWERVTADIESLRGVLVDPQGRREVMSDLLSGGDRRALEVAVSSVQAAVAAYRAAVEELGRDEFVDPDRQAASVAENLRRATGPLHRVRDATAGLIGSFARPMADFDALAELVACGARLAEMIEEDELSAPRLESDFAPYFSGASTDWAEVDAALDWAQQFLDATGAAMNDALRLNATAPLAPEEYSSRAEKIEAMLALYVETLRVLDQRFDVNATGWQPWWDAAPLVDLEFWAADLHEAAGEAPAWVQYRAAVAVYDDLLGARSTDALHELISRAEDARAEDATAILEHRVYEQWLEQVYAVEPELRDFNRIDHEADWGHFRELDSAFSVAARRRVRERGLNRYPEQNTDVLPPRVGELATLRGELSRRRRRSVRWLIQRTPGVLQRLKPCFLMSPLAVSRYLSGSSPESGHVEFDVVIFDEASQVFPEEAVPAMERANQVIVAGDRHQLPPTTFFLGDRDDEDFSDDDDDSDPNLLEGRESILDVMVGLGGAGIAERYLSVHYRSRCENLIRFSNREFYENRLLTFPGPDPGDACVRDEYLPDATYDAGGSRTNRGEAERVTEIVFDLMETLPGDESVGVVALSRAQADLIEDLIEHGRLDRRHLDERFREDHEERFFVKNLENVQGDERDHMILSVGYGPTPDGRVPNRFGPINQAGGERRLNVAVTRARRSMTVVHSLRAEDIAAQSPGARQLRRYLEYVRNPDTALEAEITGTGEPESPFEEAVLAVLRRRGHSVASQVGVSGYRIDLAIRSIDGATFDLGIECDGATYHRSPAARDRDWLRQQVLEGLGWSIHRVWSTAWIRDPEGEIQAIERALELARELDRAGPPPDPSPEPDSAPTRPPDSAPASASSAPGGAPIPEVGAIDDNDPPPPAAAEELLASEVSAVEASPAVHRLDTVGDVPAIAGSGLFGEYHWYSGEPIDGDPLKVPVERLAERLTRIVESEWPVHIDVVVERLRIVLDTQRVGGRLRTRIVDLAMPTAIVAGALGRDGDFLWLAGERGETVRPRHNPDRPVQHVPDAELDAGILLVAKWTCGAEQDELVRETAREFGWRRTGLNIQERLNSRIERLVESGWLLRRGDTLIVVEDEPPGQ